MLLPKLSASKGRGQAGAVAALSTLSSSTHPQHPAGKCSPSQPTSPAIRPCLLQPSPASLPGTEQQPAALLPAGLGVPSSSAPTLGDGPSRGAGRTSPFLPSPLGTPQPGQCGAGAPTHRDAQESRDSRGARRHPSSRHPQPRHLPPPATPAPGKLPTSPQVPGEAAQPHPIAQTQVLGFYEANKTFKSVFSS